MVKLSVLCTVYNHAKFIRQALDGFVMQKTNFPFEVLVHDDASTDGSTEIIREYAERYPDIIKPIYQTENQWRKGISISKTFLYPHVRGEYVALCEGDDYWIDDNKLQRQVDFLDAHPDFSICFHPVEVKWEDNSQPDSIFPIAELRFHKTVLDLSDLLQQNFIQTNSVVYRWRFHKDSTDLMPSHILPGDWFLHLLHAQTGKIGFLPEVMAVYRKHEGGIWYESGRSDMFYVRNGIPHINFFYKVYERFGVLHKKSIDFFAQNTLCALLNHREFDKLRQFADQFPELYDETSAYLYEKLKSTYIPFLPPKTKHSKWCKLCGKIVKRHKTTYYFLYIPIYRIYNDQQK